MLLPFFKAGDVYEAWLFAYRSRIERHHLAGFPNPATWNELTGQETEAYRDMAEQLNRQLQALLLEIAFHIITEETERGAYRIQTTPQPTSDA